MLSFINMYTNLIPALQRFYQRTEDISLRKEERFKFTVPELVMYVYRIIKFAKCPAYHT